MIELRVSRIERFLGSPKSQGTSRHSLLDEEKRFLKNRDVHIIWNECTYDRLQKLSGCIQLVGNK